MEILAIGETVATTTGTSSGSRVLGFTHRQPQGEFDFLHIRARGESGNCLGTNHSACVMRTWFVEITLTHSHYLYTDRDLRIAGDIRVGDRVQCIPPDHDGSRVASHAWHLAEVVDVTNVQRRGLFNPHSIDGDLIVDHVRVSCYTQTVHPRLAHALLGPIRLAVSILGRNNLVNPLMGLFDGDRTMLARAAPQGPTSLSI